MTKLIAYYEGDISVMSWLKKLLCVESIDFRKMPVSNDSADYADLPSYISDILYLDKPDIILASNVDGHEKPLLSIEFASCTPQYQHALQRFSRMLASASADCPSIIIMAEKKRENGGDGKRIYSRSSALEYGAVKLMDTFGLPCFVFDWPTDEDFYLSFEEHTAFPPINDISMAKLKEFIYACIDARKDLNYSDTLLRKGIVMALIDENRAQAYKKGVPSIENPSGGEGKSSVKLDLKNTSLLIDEISDISPTHQKLMAGVSSFIVDREKSLVFYPSRVTAHAGDPYVGMIGYYDIAFTRSGRSTRERIHNLVAYADGVSMEEVLGVMNTFNAKTCPFAKEFAPSNSKKYNYHLKNGCKETKSKPVRIYAELADIVVFKDGVLIST